MKLVFSLEFVNLDASGLHVLLPVCVGEQQTQAYMIVDTGASKSVIDKALLQEQDYHELHVDSVESSQLTNMIEGSIISLHVLHIAECAFENFEALTMSLEHVNSIYERFVHKPIAGLIGGDFLIKYQAIIDYRKKRLVLYL